MALPCQRTAPLGHFGFTAAGCKLIPNPVVRADVDEVPDRTLSLCSRRHPENSYGSDTDPMPLLRSRPSVQADGAPSRWAVDL